MVDPEVREAQRVRPAARRVMTQRWSFLSFIHFAVDPIRVQSVLPGGLEVDTYPDATGRQMAWIGLVPFQIRDLTVAPGLRCPTATTFLETNVRTYVHQGGANPGVWFFSLDAASMIACRSARLWFGLPYWHAKMDFSQEHEQRSYSCKRFGPNPVTSRSQLLVGEQLKAPVVGDFEYFLVERYLLYSFHQGKLRTGRVHHTPYPLHRATILQLDDELVDAAGFKFGDVASVLYSPGVNVEIFPLRSSSLSP